MKTKKIDIKDKQLLQFFHYHKDLEERLTALEEKVEKLEDAIAQTSDAVRTLLDDRYFDKPDTIIKEEV
jgi:uncharacterized protein YigA (DUF484 family)